MRQRDCSFIDLPCQGITCQASFLCCVDVVVGTHQCIQDQVEVLYWHVLDRNLCLVWSKATLQTLCHVLWNVWANVNSKIRFGLGFLMATFFFVFGSLFGRKKSPFSAPLAVPNQGVYYPCQITCFWMYCGVYYFIVNECIWHKWLKVGFVGAMLGLCLSYVGARTVCPIRFHEVSGNDFRDHRWPNHRWAADFWSVFGPVKPLKSTQRPPWKPGGGHTDAFLGISRAILGAMLSHVGAMLGQKPIKIWALREGIRFLAFFFPKIVLKDLHGTLFCSL